MTLSNDDLQNVRMLIANNIDFFIDTFYHFSFDTSVLHKATDDEKEYSCVLYNDEVHNYDEVIDTVSGALSGTESIGFAVAQAIDTKGRDIIYTGQKDDCIGIAKKIKSIGLHILIEESKTIKNQEKCADLMFFIYDLIYGPYNRPNQLQKSLEMILCQELMKPWCSRIDNIGLNDNHQSLDVVYKPISALDEVISVQTSSTQRQESLFSQFLHRFNPIGTLEDEEDTEDDLDEESQENRSIYKGRLKPCNYELSSEFPLRKKQYRIDYLLHFHRKTWKSFRICLMDLILKSFCFTNTLVDVYDPHPGFEIALTTRRDDFAILYFENYPQILHDILYKEREPYHTINDLGVQILTVPSIALHLEKQLFASYKFLILFMQCLTFQQSEPFKYNTKNDVGSFELSVLDVTKPAIKQSLYTKISHDLLYFINTEQLQNQIASHFMESQDSLHLFIAVLTVCDSMDHHYHYKNRHVPFESKSWHPAFNLSLSLHQFQPHFVNVLSFCKNKLHHFFLTCFAYLQHTYCTFDPIVKSGVSIHYPLIRFLSAVVEKHPREYLAFITQFELHHVENIDIHPVVKSHCTNNHADPLDILSYRLSAAQVYNDQVTALIWIRNGGVPFHVLKLLNHHFHSSSLIHHDKFLKQYHNHHYFEATGYQLDEFKLYFKDKYLLMSENYVLQLLPCDTSAACTFSHLLASQSMKKSELLNYFNDLSELTPILDTCEQITTPSGYKYKLTSPKYKINPFHACYSKSNMDDLLQQFDPTTFITINYNEEIEAAYHLISDITKSSLLLDILLYYNKCNKKDNSKFISLKFNPKKSKFYQWVFENYTDQDNTQLSNKNQDMLDKIKKQQELAMSQYQEEMDELSSNDEEELCIKCKQPCKENYGYLSSIVVTWFKKITVHKCHLVHKDCITIPNISTLEEYYSLYQSCPYCRSMCTLYLPIIETEESQHHIEQQSDFLLSEQGNTLPEMVLLPKTYEDLLVQHECRYCGHQQTLGMCVCCGDKVCLQYFKCHEQHVKDCTVQYGVYLILKTSQIVIKMHTFMVGYKGIYLTKEHEEDIGIRQGKPLLLSNERLEKLREMVRTGEIVHFVIRQQVDNF